MLLVDVLRWTEPETLAALRTNPLSQRANDYPPYVDDLLVEVFFEASHKNRNADQTPLEGRPGGGEKIVSLAVRELVGCRSISLDMC